MGKVEKILLSIKKKAPRVEIKEGMFLENYGLDGDSYSEAGAEKQVTVLSQRGRDLVEKDSLSGLCFERFMETVRISGIPAEKMVPGTTLIMGEAVFKVTEYRKKCYLECPIIKTGRTCGLASDVRFLTVIKSGKVEKGDIVELI